MEESKAIELRMITARSVLGEGRYGTVLAVTIGKRMNGKSGMFALKIMDKAQTIRRKKVENVLLEKRILCELSSLFTTKLHGTFTDSHSLYFLLEFCAGGDLFGLISKRKKPLPENHIKFYAASLVLALNFIHSKGIVFADLKPENILIDEKGYLKLADFGSAHYISDESKQYCEGQQTNYGTPSYCAPEMIRRERFSLSVDMWALGCVLFEMASGGVLAFNDRNPKTLAFKIQHASIPLDLLNSSTNFNGTGSNISQNFKDFLSLILDRNPETRLQSFEKIQQHAWFKNFNWESLANRTMNAPFVPKIASMEDFSHFDSSFTGKNAKEYLQKASNGSGKSWSNKENNSEDNTPEVVKEDHGNGDYDPFKGFQEMF